MLAAGTYTVTFRSASNGFKDLLGVPLDGANNGNPAGSNYVATFVVTAPPVVVGIPSFARGPDSVDAINLPNSATAGIPLNLSNGTGVTSGSFTLQYNSALLTITGSLGQHVARRRLAVARRGLHAGHRDHRLQQPDAADRDTAVVRLGGLVATVPNSAAAVYKSKALLHWSGVQLNGGAIAVEGDDAVQVVAYFGDANGDGTLSGGDAADISAVNASTNPATGTLGGFSAYPLADPAIIGDLNNNGNADAPDVTLLNSFLSGTPRPQIPTIPTGLTIVATGPDPSLSLPTTLQAHAGRHGGRAGEHRHRPSGRQHRRDRSDPGPALRSASVHRVGRRRAVGFVDRRLAVDDGGECSNGRDRHRPVRQIRRSRRRRPEAW